MRKVYFYELSEKEYENNCQLTMEPSIEEFIDDLYTIEDFYSDNASIVLEKMPDMPDGWYTFEVMDDNGDTERRYVYVEKIVDEEEE